MKKPSAQQKALALRGQNKGDTVLKKRDIEKAIAVLSGNPNLTCVFCKGDICHTSEKRGVAPLIEFLDNGADTVGFSCADRVVGKGAAFLYCALKVQSVYAQVISQKAAEVLEQNGIKCSFEKEVPYIINRSKTGPCPIESAVENVTDTYHAVEVIKETLKNLNS